MKRQVRWFAKFSHLNCGWQIMALLLVCMIALTACSLDLASKQADSTQTSSTSSQATDLSKITDAGQTHRFRESQADELKEGKAQEFKDGQTHWFKENRVIGKEAGQAAPYGNQAEVLQAQAHHAEKVEVFFSAKVLKLLPDDTIGLPHQRFILLLDNRSTVLVAHDIKYAPKVPVQAGDIVTIKGEYIWNPRGGVVHWTHHTDTPRHEGGFIDFRGSKYQ